MSPGKTGDVLIESDNQWPLRSWRDEAVAFDQLSVALNSSEEREDLVADQEGERNSRDHRGSREERNGFGNGGSSRGDWGRGSLEGRRRDGY